MYAHLTLNDPSRQIAAAARRGAFEPKTVAGGGADATRQHRRWRVFAALAHVAGPTLATRRHAIA